MINTKNNLEEKISGWEEAKRTIKKTTQAVALALAIGVMGASGCGHKYPTECCTQLACGGGEYEHCGYVTARGDRFWQCSNYVNVCDAANPNNAQECLTNSKGEWECCGCHRESAYDPNSGNER